MVKTINIKDWNIDLVFRHKWDKQTTSLDLRHMFRKKQLGLWYEKNKIVGKKNVQDPKEWDNNLVNAYTIGIELIICKAWVRWNQGGMTFGEKKKS